MVIQILRGGRAERQALDALDDLGARAYCCAVTWAEVWAGVRAGEEPMVERFLLQRGEVLLDAAMGWTAGRYLARYAWSHGLRIADALIAAAASTSGLRLWTFNRRHYPMPDVDFYTPPR